MFTLVSRSQPPLQTFRGEGLATRDYVYMLTCQERIQDLLYGGVDLAAQNLVIHKGRVKLINERKRGTPISGRCASDVVN